MYAEILSLLNENVILSHGKTNIYFSKKLFKQNLKEIGSALLNLA